MPINVTAVGKHLKIFICELIFYPKQYFFFFCTQWVSPFAY